MNLVHPPHFPVRLPAEPSFTCENTMTQAPPALIRETFPVGPLQCNCT
ncbi:hypothetical protein REG_1824, partial [Candidatus Regiella insecticola LSR1]